MCAGGHEWRFLRRDIYVYIYIYPLQYDGAPVISSYSTSRPEPPRRQNLQILTTLADSGPGNKYRQAGIIQLHKAAATSSDRCGFDATLAVRSPSPVQLTAAEADKRQNSQYTDSAYSVSNPSWFHASPRGSPPPVHQKLQKSARLRHSLGLLLSSAHKSCTRATRSCIPAHHSGINIPYCQSATCNPDALMTCSKLS